MTTPTTALNNRPDQNTGNSRPHNRPSPKEFSKPRDLSASLKWIHKLRAVPSYTDPLKPEYLETNLRHSRTLIADVKELAELSRGLASDLQERVGQPLERLHSINKELDWLEPASR